MSNYWQDRMAQSQAALTQKTTKEVERQLRKYYLKAANEVIAEFEFTYEKLLNTVGEGREPTPADLYKLDRYWKMQAQIKDKLNKLGSKQINALSKAFEMNYFEVYYSIGFEGLQAFSTVDEKAVKQFINQIWCADGKSWSQRVWENTERLADTLNEELINCVTTGKSTNDLMIHLQERFSVSYSAADSLVRTELSHIQTQAAQQRYTDYGIQEVQIWADYDERRCDVCGALHKKVLPVSAQMPIPAHPRCRCSIIPVVKI